MILHLYNIDGSNFLETVKKDKKKKVVLKSAETFNDVHFRDRRYIINCNSLNFRK